MGRRLLRSGQTVLLLLLQLRHSLIGSRYGRPRQFPDHVRNCRFHRHPLHRHGSALLLATMERTPLRVRAPPDSGTDQQRYEDWYFCGVGGAVSGRRYFTDDICQIFPRRVDLLRIIYYIGCCGCADQQCGYRPGQVIPRQRANSSANHSFSLLLLLPLPAEIIRSLL